MPSERSEFTVSELVKNGVIEKPLDGNHGETHPKSKDYVLQGIPFVMASDMISGRVDTLNCKFIAKEQADKLRKGFAKTGDVLLSHKATIGRTAIVEETVYGYVMLTPQVTYYRIKDRDRLNNKYLRYYFDSAPFQELFSQWAGGGSTRAYLGITGQLKLPIVIPSLPEQKAIAHILGSLDDKIELNRKMNATLEGMAQALFKSWFVDFDPVIDNALVAGNPIPDELADRAEVRRQALANGTANREVAKHFPANFQQTESMGWIPEGWETGKLSDLLEIKYGKDHKKLNEGSIPVYGSGGLMRYADKSLYSGESVLIPRKGTLSNILYLNEEFWTVDTMFYTIPKIKNAPKYSFYHLNSLDFASMNVGSAVPSMTTKVLNELPIVLPGANVLQQFDTILTSYFLKTEANNKQTQTLIKLRDNLLPKLISGDLCIPKN
jgi:type I restriction enzyme S subunit